MFSSSLVVLALAASSFATIFTTAPVAQTSWAAGTPVQITWQEGTDAPSLAQFGQTKISIYVGNVQQQTSLQTIGTVDVSTTTSIPFTPDASIGPSGSEYFVRFESVALKDPTNPAFPALAFSSKFALTGMTGVFSADVQSQIAGQATAGAIGGGSATTSASSVGTTTAAGTTAAGTTAAGTTAKANTSTSKPTTTAVTAAKGNGASTVSASIVLVAAGFFGLATLL